MGFRIKHIFQWNVRQPKPSYTAMVLILTSALSVVSITVTLILSVLKNFKTNECVTIFTVAFTIIGTFLGMMLVILRKMRETYPLNIIMLILYGACISVAQGYSVINACVLVKVGAWAIAFVLLSILVPIGMVIKTDLSEHTSALIIYCAAELFITTVVFTGLMIADHKKIALAVFVAGVLAILIPLAIGFGQLTFGTNLSYTFNPDYCIAALTLFTTLLGFFVTSSVEVHFIEGLIKNKLL
ncbi:hypothetical protein Smp_121930.1 [Schistosoma mansoni]|uniref:Bax inhibitor 1-related n=1 Tax=Schistosoma mansoni TaxID=6183 RepID=G4VGD0_SCHMA|nr:hypothetical protein Smp_121930.1 [Schistosoma mansoni]|eukprot:XP_018650668.1 hypothetical protein Smp_121930.1 [Schistosoma mansoni]